MREIKRTIQCRIDKKQKEIKPYKQSMREIEDHLTELEALQSALADIVELVSFPERLLLRA